jgi:RhtB (resistance to homoserine/threonine) family protein
MELGKIVSIAFIALLGAMSPGPDFAVVTKNAISGDFRKGLLCSLGVAAALVIHLTYCVFGIAFVILESPTLFYALKYLGAAYLFYLGIQLLRERRSVALAKEPLPHQKRGAPFVSGFLCNLLNPKCTLFMLSLFTQFIDPQSTLFEKALFGLVILAMTFGWFVFLSFLITHRYFQRHFARFQFAICKVMGVGLCLLALYVALISSR